jgi:hypothetical protein
VTKLLPFVKVSTPSNDENVGAPVNIQALASPTAGHTISGWKIYVDGVRVYDAGAVNAIDTNVALSPGVHVLLVRAWDTSGAHGDQTLNLTIVSKPAVAVSVPAPGSNVISPINIQASATPTSGHRLGTNDVEKVLYTFEPVGGTRGVALPEACCWMLRVTSTAPGAAGRDADTAAVA